MENICHQCNNLSSTLHKLKCSHQICSSCLSISSLSACLCPLCDTITVLEELPEAEDPNHALICLDCKDGVFRMKEFFEGRHRTHEVQSISKIFSQVQKIMRKHQLSLDIQSQGLFTNLENIASEKRKTTEQYNNNILAMKQQFEKLRVCINQEQQRFEKKYEEIAMKKIQEFDRQLKQIRKEILKCQSYVESIELHLIGDRQSHPYFSTEFFIKFDNIFTKFSSSLSKMRLSNSLQNFQLPKIHFDVLIKIKNQISQIKLFHHQNSRHFEKNEESHKDDVENYFESKRREIFETSSPNLEIQDQNRREPMKYYDIDGRIEQMRRALNIGEGKEHRKTQRSYLVD